MFYKVQHTMVGPFRQGQVISDDQIKAINGADAQRLLDLNAISAMDDRDAPDAPDQPVPSPQFNPERDKALADAGASPSQKNAAAGGGEDDDLNSLMEKTVKELKAVADDEGAEYAANATKEQIAQAILDHRANKADEDLPPEE